MKSSKTSLATNMNISLSQASRYMFGAENVVITGHVHPDGDCLGSMLALYRLCQQKRVKARLLLDDEIPSFYAFLPDLDAIERPIEPIEADLLIVLDASDIERIGKVREYVSAPVLNLDHHISNTGFADYLFLDPLAAATGSILYSLFRQEGIKPDELTATCLYTAIATDCGFFRYANTTSDTLRYAAELLDCGVQPALVAEALETKPASNIFTLIHVLETLEIVLEGKVACVTVSPDVLEIGESTDDFINYPRSIEGVEVAIMFKQTDASFTRISLRSRNVDVSAIALSFGGGGHKRAAGCSIASPLDEAKRQIFVAVASALEEVK
jgi:phosphoesterase RecJ-like protein